MPLRKDANDPSILPESKYLRCRKTGYVHVWTEAFAKRPAEFENLDELPDDFQKDQKYSEDAEPADIRFMKKDEVYEEARIKYNFALDPKAKAAELKSALRKLRNGEVPETGAPIEG